MSLILATSAQCQTIFGIFDIGRDHELKVYTDYSEENILMNNGPYAMNKCIN